MIELLRCTENSRLQVSGRFGRYGRGRGRSVMGLGGVILIVLLILLLLGKL